MNHCSLRGAAAAQFCAGQTYSLGSCPAIRRMRRRLLNGVLSVAILSLPSVPAARASSCTDDTWMPTATVGAPTVRTEHTAVWTGREMIIWGGVASPTGLLLRESGGRYDPVTNSWNSTSTVGAASARMRHSAVWTGTEMIIWGGIYQSSGGGYFSTNTGARYNPFTNTWVSMSTRNAPLGRTRHTAVWTGKEMIVWGGTVGPGLNTGGAYDPVTDKWRTITTENAPTARSSHSAVWTGTEMIVWGGHNSGFGYFETGGRYNPATDTWTPTNSHNAPSPRTLHAAVWTGNEMVVWGGASPAGPPLSTGARYNPATDSWSATSATNVPHGRDRHTAVWTGSQMIIWGGADGAPLNSGGKYNPATDSWTGTSDANAPSKRRNYAVVWTGDEMIVWGGATDPPDPVALDTGAVYCVGVPPQLSNISTRARVLTGNNVLIAGFIISGTDEKRLILRGIGPSLTGVGVSGPLANPVLELRDSKQLLAMNDDWKDLQDLEIAASGIPPSNEAESAIAGNFAAKNSAYTAILTGRDANQGIGLIEVYDLNRATNSKLVNISTRGLIDTDENVMIAGFISGGNAGFSARVVIRGIGPSLFQSGVTNSLADPMVELYDANGVQFAVNDNWQDTQQTDIQNSGLAPADNREAAIIATLAPGAYTAIVRGKNNTSGVGLVEVYDLQQ